MKRPLLTAVPLVAGAAPSFALSQRAGVELRKTPLRLLGIALTDLTKEDYVQTSLFDTADERKNKSKKLDKTVDALRSKYGRSTIQRGALLQDTHEVGKKYTAQMEQKTTSE